MKVAGLAPATAKYTTPALDLTPQGTFETTWIDDVITSPWLMIFVIVSVLALIGFAIFSAIDVRNRSLRRRMAQYVTVPSEDESRSAARRGRGDARRHRAAHGRRPALVAAVRDGCRARRLQPLGARDRRLDDRRRHRRLDRRRDRLPVALGPAHRSRSTVRDALVRVAPGLEDAQGIRGAARRQPRRARRRDAHGPLDDGALSA